MFTCPASNSTYWEVVSVDPKSGNQIAAHNFTYPFYASDEISLGHNSLPDGSIVIASFINSTNLGVSALDPTKLTPTWAISLGKVKSHTDIALYAVAATADILASHFFRVNETYVDIAYPQTQIHSQLTVGESFGPLNAYGNSVVVYNLTPTVSGFWLAPLPLSANASNRTWFALPTTPQGTFISGVLMDSQGNVYTALSNAGRNNFTFVSYSTSAKPRWQSVLSYPQFVFSEPLVLTDDESLCLFSTFSSAVKGMAWSLTAFNTTNGAQVWSASASALPWSDIGKCNGPVPMAGGIIALFCENKTSGNTDIIALNQRTGAALPGRVAVSSSLLYYADSAPSLVKIDSSGNMYLCGGDQQSEVTCLKQQIASCFQTKTGCTVE